MKRLITICLVALMTLSTFADVDPEVPENAVNVSLAEAHPGEISPGTRHKAPARRPAMFYLDNYIYLQSPYNIDVAQIIIRDADDNILYSTIASINSGVNTITLPLDVADEMDSVEFIYNDHDYYGYF